MIEYILIIPAILIALTVHEWSHGYTSYKLGDPTAKLDGRLSLNPLRHLDPIGVLFMIFFRFGWAKPVSVNPSYFKKPKRDMALTAAAGPVSNLILGFISVPLYLIILNLANKLAATGKINSDFAYNFFYYLLLFMFIFHSLNLGLFVFNLLPVPPLDGSKVFFSLLPDKAYYKVMRYERNMYFAMLIWLLLGDTISRGLLSVPFVSSSAVLSAIARIFSLDYIISFCVGGISDLFFAFWRLFPFLT